MQLFTGAYLPNTSRSFAMMCMQHSVNLALRHFLCLSLDHLAVHLKAR